MHRSSCTNLRVTPRSQSARSLNRETSALALYPWSSLLTSDKSCEGKLSLLTEVIKYGLDTIIPVRSIKIHETDRPWLSTQLITCRQRAFASGNQPLFKTLRNKVNRKRKRCRKVYYENKVRDLQDSKPRYWWREVKQLCGSAKNSRAWLDFYSSPRPRVRRVYSCKQNQQGILQRHGRLLALN